MLNSQNIEKSSKTVSENVKAFVSGLAELTSNRKSVIVMLMELANENFAHAAEIVEVVENHLTKVASDLKLPTLYLMDCIVKNDRGGYVELFSHNIVPMFCGVFRVVNRKSRVKMYQLRQTWSNVFSSKSLHSIDVQITSLDPAWPVISQPNSSIYANQKCFDNTISTVHQFESPTFHVVSLSNADSVSSDTLHQSIEKQKELIQLQQNKLEIEIMQIQGMLRDHLSSSNVSDMTPPPSPQNFSKAKVPEQILPTPSISFTVDDKGNKQLSTATQSRTTTLDKLHSSTDIVNSVGRNQKLEKENLINGPRIQPAICSRVSATVNRPFFDQRSLRQPVNQQMNQKKMPNSFNYSENISNLNNKNNSDSSIKFSKSINNTNFRNPLKVVCNENQKSYIRMPPHHSQSCFTHSNSSLFSSKKFEHEKSFSSTSPSSQSRNETKTPETGFFKSPRESEPSNSDNSLSVFRYTEDCRNRNYVKRNRWSEFGPESSSQHADLILRGPPRKQQRLIEEGKTTYKNKSAIPNNDDKLKNYSPYNDHIHKSSKISISSSSFSWRGVESRRHCREPFVMRPPMNQRLKEPVQQRLMNGIMWTPPATFTEDNQSLTQQPQDIPKSSTDLFNPKQLKLRQSARIEKLYSGKQCSSCGIRFSHEQSMDYSKHLDSHFRKNRKAKTKSSREWYFPMDDWKSYETIEKSGEQEKNYFDRLKEAETSTEKLQLPCIKADQKMSAICHVCGDKFEIFFNQDEEEWQFKNAVLFEENIFHPRCLEEYQQSFQNADFVNTSTHHQEIRVLDKLSGEEIVLDDDECMITNGDVVEVIPEDSHEPEEHEQKNI